MFKKLSKHFVNIAKVTQFEFNAFVDLDIDTGRFLISCIFLSSFVVFFLFHLDLGLANSFCLRVSKYLRPTLFLF